jgi:hypothetical protein
VPRTDTMSRSSASLTGMPRERGLLAVLVGNVALYWLRILRGEKMIFASQPGLLPTVHRHSLKRAVGLCLFARVGFLQRPDDPVHPV